MPHIDRWIWLVALGVLLLLVALIAMWGEFIKFFNKLRKSLAEDTTTWKSYLRGQGILLFGFLLIGGALSWVSFWKAPPTIKVITGGQLLEFRQLNPSEKPVYEDIDVGNYSEITVLTKTNAPQNGSAVVTLYPDEQGLRKIQVKQIEGVTASWTKLEEENFSKHISIVAGRSTRTGSQPATQLDILVYLSGK